MIPRHLTEELVRTAEEYPVFSVTGPRQSGKTTLVRNTFTGYDYVNLEMPDVRERAQSDPRGLLEQYSHRVIFDEVQRAPDLLSYLQPMVDEDDTAGRFGLTGSQNFLLNESVSQSLAGRCGILHLLPFSRSELERGSYRPLESLDDICEQSNSSSPAVLSFELLLKGFYPRIHDKNLRARNWYRNYFQTYVERDVRQLVNIGDMETFERFVRFCAGRNGQLLNMSALANDCGVAHTTIKRWISVLEDSFIIMLLKPYYRNFNKRLRKSPKLYFLDTGLLCYLLNIRTADELRIHNMRGPVFETYVISEIYKQIQNRGKDSSIYFWRDSNDREIDLLIDAGPTPMPVEIKSARTINSGFFDIS
ncbi:MAG: ATP-binding protein, partial [Planctomycetes bacterium]|nr:ATP-binding protein [Planctomycetota bacterium]